MKVTENVADSRRRLSWFKWCSHFDVLIRSVFLQFILVNIWLPKIVDHISVSMRIEQNVT